MKRSTWDDRILVFIPAMLLLTVLSAGPAEADDPPTPATSSQETAAQEMLPVGEPLDDPLLFLDPVARFYHIPGSALTPVDSTVNPIYDGMGCIHVTGGGLLLNAPLEVATGARIVLLRLYYDDTSPSSDISSWITRYNEEGTNYEDLVMVESIGSGGHGSNYGNLDHIVDTYSWSYVLNVRLNVPSSQQQVCGLRVMYYDPEIFQDDFESGDTAAWSATEP